MKTKLLTLLFFLMLSLSSMAQRLAPFLSITGNRGYPALVRPVPYEKPVSRFEFIDTSCAFLHADSGRMVYIGYFEITDSTQETGFRFISPVSDNLLPGKGDIATAAYEANGAGNTKGFRGDFKVFKRRKSSDGMVFWDELKNESPAALQHEQFPSLRLTDKGREYLLEPAIYKIVITPAAGEKMEGSFILQVGTIPRVRFSEVFSSPENLMK